MSRLVILIAWVGAAGCVRSECGNEVLSEVASPDNRHVATVFLHDCGATAPLARVVSIRAAGSAFDGNDLDEYVLTMQGQHEISVRWDGADQLVIRRPPVASDIFKELKSWGDVQVTTEP